MPDLTDIDPQDVLARVESADLSSTWTDEKRKEFCQTFANRVLVARYIMVRTADKVCAAAMRRMFISEKHLRPIFRGLGADTDRFGHALNRFEQFIQYDPDPATHYTPHHHVGGRSLESLNIIAQERAETILKNLPPLSKAVKIIDVETARKIDRRDRLQAEGEELREKLAETCGIIRLSEVDQSMTIGAFRQMVADREEQRQKLIKKMNHITQEGGRLETEIAKTLYAGLPGLSEAIVEVVRNHLEQALALEATGRRVDEQVLYGDSAAAVELLRHFEKDEVSVSSKVEDQFREALEKLKVAVTRKPKKATKELRA